MKFIMKHGKTDKDIQNLRQEIEVFPFFNCAIMPIADILRVDKLSLRTQLRVMVQEQSTTPVCDKALARPEAQTYAYQPVPATNFVQPNDRHTDGVVLENWALPDNRIQATTAANMENLVISDAAYLSEGLSPLQVGHGAKVFGHVGGSHEGAKFFE
ncbi:hypothetical protein POM88_024080 [Heracleum sosnowskyi]|uniref:Uncharacterized protein n=1 Tax=Heracleum sosnowskyi TaxID=360622 RepID=A0AAD8IIG9_9APIA|nr:hypothetical protein POM88_024080 [Heracleum sosnowskyi]